MKHTYKEIACTFALWGEYADPSGYCTREMFDAMTEQEKIQFLEDCFGPEVTE